MNVTKTMEVNKSIQHGSEHFASLGSREGALRKNLGEVFFGIFHHDVEAIPVFDTAPADVVNAQQIRMNKLHDAPPERDLEIRVRPGGDEFDGGFFRLRLREVGGGKSGKPPFPPKVAQPGTIIYEPNLSPSPEIAPCATP